MLYLIKSNQCLPTANELATVNWLLLSKSTAETS